MRGNRPNKPVDQLQRPLPDRLARRTVGMNSTPIADRIVPAAPQGLHPKAREAWKSYFASPMAAAFDLTTDLPALRRWAYCISERERFSVLVKKSPLVKGSNGQLRTNPLASLVSDLTREIERAEDKFGLNPLSRMRLGQAVGQAEDILSRVADSGEYDDAETVVFDESDLIDAVAVAR